MIVVLIHHDDWLNERIMSDLVDGAYRLRCGLSIPVHTIRTPNPIRAIRNHYVIRFDNEKDAAWFVLAVGGKIYNG